MLTKRKTVKKSAVANSRGQSLIEYLLLTSLMAVAAMGVMQVMSHSVNAKFAQVTESIQGKNPESIHLEAVEKTDYEKKDMSDFMTGATKKKKGKGSGGGPEVGSAVGSAVGSFVKGVISSSEVEL